MHLFKTFSLGLLVATSCLAQETSAPLEKPVEAPKPQVFNPRAMVRVDVLMLSVPEEKLLPLLPQLRDPDQIIGAERALLTMVANREAVLESWPEVTTYDGTRAVCESIVESRYPVEFISAGIEAFLPASALPAAKTPPTPAEKAVDALFVSGQAVPRTFETRNLGATLEVEPYISPDNKAVTLSICPQAVRLERTAEFPSGIASNGQKITVQQPIFTTSKVNTSLTLRDGERRLIYLGKSNEDKKRFEVFIVGAKIVPGVAGKK